MPMGSPTLAMALLTQTRSEHAVLAGADEREQLLAATWLARHRSPATRTAYAKDLAGWLDWLAGHHLDVLTARTLHVQLFTRAQLDAGAAPASVNRRLAALSSFYAHCAEHGLFGHQPAQRHLVHHRIDHRPHRLIGPRDRRRRDAEQLGGLAVHLHGLGADLVFHLALSPGVDPRDQLDQQMACDEDRNRILNGLSPAGHWVGFAQRGGRRPAGSRWSCQRAKASMEGRL